MPNKCHTSRACSQSQNAWPLISSSKPHASHKLSLITFRRYRLAFMGMMLWHTLQAKDFILFGKCNLQILRQKDLWLSPFENPSIHPSAKSENAILYVLLTMNFPLGVYTHTSLSSSKRALNKILRIAWASVGIKICFINLAHQSQDKGSMRALTLACVGSIFGWYRTLKVADSLSHLLA